MELTLSEKAREQGEQDYFSGVRINENPYKADDFYSAWWQAGWLMAKELDHGKRY